MRSQSREGSRSSSPDREFLQESLAGAQGESFLIPLTFAVVLYVTGFAFGGDDLAGVSIHAIDAISGVVAILTFALSTGLRRLLTRQTINTNLAVWTLSGIAAALTPALALNAMSLPVPDSVVEQIPLGFVSYAGIMYVYAIFVTSFRSASLRLRTLREQHSAIEHRRSTLSEEVRLIRGAMKSEIQQELSAALASSTVSLNEGDEHARMQVALHLRDVIDQVVRPLSWTLSTDEQTTAAQHEPSCIDSQAKKVRQPRFPVEFSRLMSPTLFSFMAIVFIVPAGFVIDGIPGLISATITAVVIAGLLMLAARPTSTWQITPWIGVILLTAATALLASVVPLLFILMGLPLAGAPGMVVGFFLAQAGSASMMSLAASRVEQIRAARRANDELDLLAQQLKQQIWVAKSELAKTVHGQVQSKLLVAALRLEAATEAQSSRLALANIREAVDSIADGDEPRRLPLADSLSALRQAWNGACEIVVEVDSETEERLDGDPIARSCVMDVLIEAVANAAKHSRTASIDVSLIVSNGTTVEMLILSRGTLDDSGSSPGFGTTVIEEATTSWSLSQRGDHVALWGAVALTGVASQPSVWSTG